MTPRVPREENGRLHPRDFRSCVLRPRRDGGFVVRPALRLRIVGAVLWIPGALLALLGLLSIPKGGVAFLGLALFGGLLWALGRWARGPSLIFDARQGRLRGGYPWARRGFARDEVAAIRIAEAGDCVLRTGTVFRAWPLDLRLRSGGFLNVSHDSDLEGARATGAAMAQALGVPLERAKGVPAVSGPAPGRPDTPRRPS